MTMSSEGFKEETKRMVPLSMLPRGKSARVVRIEGGHLLRRRLADIGIIPGKVIEVAHGWGGGPRVVIVDGAKIVLGRGMLHKIIVEVSIP
ncbi:MAG: FeoA family protein [Spirochaetota bacterium]